MLHDLLLNTTEHTFGINACLLDLPHDRVLAPADRLVLVVHDGSGTSSSIVSQIACETRNSWDYNNDAELAAFLAGTNTSINNGPANLVIDGVLLFTGSSNYNCQ